MSGMQPGMMQQPYGSQQGYAQPALETQHVRDEGKRKSSIGRDVAIGVAIAALVLGGFLLVKFLILDSGDDEPTTSGGTIATLRLSMPPDVTAELYVDDKKLQAVQNGLEIPVSAGQRKITLVGKNGAKCEQEMKLPAGKITTVECIMYNGSGAPPTGSGGSAAASTGSAGSAVAMGDKTATDKAAADKVAADKLAADKAAKDKTTDKTTDKTATDKAAADKAAADKTAADKAAKDKAASDKAAADKLAADKAAADKAAASDKAAADKAAKAAADKHAAKDKPPIDKAAADKLAADKAAKAAADKAAKDKAAKDKMPPEENPIDKAAAQPSKGFLKIVPPSGAQIMVDGAAPAGSIAKLPLIPGKHKIMFILGADKHTFSVTVKAGETITLDKKDLQ
jgi:colicin import membrane protein